MNMPKLFMVTAAVWFVYAVMNAAAGVEKPMHKGLYSILSGVGSLVVVHCIAPVTGVCVPISFLSLTVSSVLGIPGTALIMVLNAFF